MTRENLHRVLYGNPTLLNLQKIASALGIEVRQLFTSSDTPTPGELLKGFVEYLEVVHRIRTVEDLENLLKLVKAEN